jgi:chaperonin GroEL
MDAPSTIFVPETQNAKRKTIEQSAFCVLRSNVLRFVLDSPTVMKQPRRTQTSRPDVVFQPNLLAGIDAIANAVKPTLGPLPRTVGIENATMRDRVPEVLDDAGTIARRIIQLPDPIHDAGAMMLRHALWRMREQCGDGGATTAVLAQAMAQEAARAMAAGAHPALLRRGMEEAVEIAVASLREQAMPFPGGRAGTALLTSLARSLCHDEEMQRVLVEVVEILGVDGAIQMVNNDARRIDREYIEGAMWESPWLTTGFATDRLQTIARIADAAIVLIDGRLTSAADVFEGLKRLHGMGHTRIVIIANDVTDEAKGVLIQAKLSNMFQILPIKAPVNDAKRAVAMSDLSALTGARMLMGDAGVFGQIREEEVGEARRVWASAKQFGIIGGRRDPVELRRNIAAVRRKMETTTDLSELDELRLRLGRLCGGLSIVRIGAATSKIQDARKDEAVRLSRALQMAAAEGMVAGGGAALLKAARSIPKGEGDVGFGYRAVAKALQSPMATLVSNAGFDAPAIVAQASDCLKKDRNSTPGFDVRRNELTDMVQAGVLDSLQIIERALLTATSVAVMAITTDAVILHREPKLQAMP